MPNHVENRLTFDCSRERLQEILTAVSRDQDKEVDGKFGVGTFDFEKVIPMPEDIYRGNLGSAERELYGKKNWYDWSVWNWGIPMPFVLCSEAVQDKFRASKATRSVKADPKKRRRNLYCPKKVRICAGYTAIS